MEDMESFDLTKRYYIIFKKMKSLQRFFGMIFLDYF